MNGKTMQRQREVRIDELQARNQALDEVLQAAKRMLRTRRKLDDPLMMELDRAVHAAERGWVTLQ